MPKNAHIFTEGAETVYLIWKYSKKNYKLNYKLKQDTRS